MKILARIPELVPQPSAMSTAAPVPQPAKSPTAPVRRQRRPGSRFPFASVAALAGIAAVAWSLASWNDGRRAEQSRLERLARMQSFSTSARTVAR
jgi:hypothetical protein